MLANQNSYLDNEKKPFLLRPTFLRCLQRTFQAMKQLIDFSKKNARNLTRAWVQLFATVRLPQDPENLHSPWPLHHQMEYSTEK